jgi:hypothetical protein
MSSSAQNHDFTCDGPVYFPAFGEASFGNEQGAERELQTVLGEDKLWFSGMAKVPENISDVIVNRLQGIAHVKAVLMGRSGEVYHVWTMIDEWTLAGRKAVYAAQKELLAKLKGFDLDFYVVPLDDGESPEGLVSDIPTIFQRA